MFDLPVSKPASNSGDGEKHWKQVCREAHGSVDDTGVEINVRVEPPLDEVLIGECYSFQLDCNVDHGLPAADFEDLVGDLSIKSCSPLVSQLTFLMILARGS